jgi:hypothetical protein
MSLKHYRKQRHVRGNTLVLVCGGLLLVAGTLFTACLFANLLFVQNLLQRFCDNVALTAACALNESDRIGEMNNLVARCRQLVYSSRETTQTIQTTSPDLEVLATQILNEDRQHAQSLETARANLVQIATGDAQNAVDTAFSNQTGIYRAILPMMRMTPPQLVSVDFGNVPNVESNVAALDGIDTLATFDETDKLVDGQSELYFGNISAPLPAADSDLTFNLSSLAAPINGNIAPARLTQVSEFQLPSQSNHTSQLPSAVRIVINANAPSAGPFSSTINSLQVTSTAATNGGMPTE